MVTANCLQETPGEEKGEKKVANGKQLLPPSLLMAFLSEHAPRYLENCYPHTHAPSLDLVGQVIPQNAWKSPCPQLHCPNLRPTSFLLLLPEPQPGLPTPSLTLNQQLGSSALNATAAQPCPHIMLPMVRLREKTGNRVLSAPSPEDTEGALAGTAWQLQVLPGRHLAQPHPQRKQLFCFVLF